jgi:O-antigen ligase
MNPSLALLICVCGIAGLFYLDRDRTLRTSKALWLPIIWLSIAGSRSVTVWFGANPDSANVQLEGSPIDAALFALLSASAIAVVIRRSRRTRPLVVANWPILVYFLYCLISVTWSYHPDVAVKRWVKSIGDLAMVLVVVTDPRPLAAIQRLISRVGFVLLPASVLLIKYYPELGRGYNPDGGPMNTGVSTDKNMLGVLLLVISLGTLRRIITLVRDKGVPGRRRHLLAQATLLAFGVSLLEMADSQTSLACFILGSGLILATELRLMRNRIARVHALCLTIILSGSLMLYAGQTQVAHALGRQGTLSGRTEIWAALLPAVSNPILGSGFEGFWISPDVVKFQRAMVGWYHPEFLNEAHNGYIEVYLNLGGVGVCLMLIILISGYLYAIKAFRLNPSIGSLMLAYIIASVAYSFTEAGFRMLDPMWIFLLLAIFSSTGVVAGFFRSEPLRVLDSTGGTSKRASASGQPIVAGQNTCAASAR